MEMSIGLVMVVLIVSLGGLCLFYWTGVAVARTVGLNNEVLWGLICALTGIFGITACAIVGAVGGGKCEIKVHHYHHKEEGKKD